VLTVALLLVTLAALGAQNSETGAITDEVKLEPISTRRWARRSWCSTISTSSSRRSAVNSNWRTYDRRLHAGRLAERVGKHTIPVHSSAARCERRSKLAGRGQPVTAGSSVRGLGGVGTALAL